jgi:hypothetical protein
VARKDADRHLNDVRAAVKAMVTVVPIEALT